MKKLAIFDLDGTLVNSIKDLSNAVNYALTKYNYKNITVDKTREFVGDGIYNLIIRSMGEENEKSKDLLSSFKEYYEKNCLAETKVYDGIKDLLLDLKEKNIKIAVLSNKKQEFTEKIVNHYFGNIFDMVLGEKNNMRMKPYPDSVLYILKELNIDKEESVIIGDSENDIKVAKNTGIFSIGCTWGFRDRKVLEDLKADIIVEKPRKIAEILK